ncbi:isochorismate synthase [Kamptonema sp. UHCC 0994]|uniref:isochorismate synthase n=1 Tax=Kamptonema sp. UHCC 0994 TaxID=3031329 RepID=UPI0023B8E5C4|nr:isochorismate synthase [Kamptonema sp. UHCC 0994]MDF0555410.1 isochorismate synthase [Kamptonema sp. UHCC 0994]
MPVIPHRTHLFQDRKELHQFLLDCQQSLTEKDSTKIVSISLEISSVDPLAVLQAIAEPDRRHFYFEKKDSRAENHISSGFAIAAIDSAIHLTVEGSQRFVRAQEFIQSCLASTIAVGTTHIPFGGPHFFCSFTFFDENIAASSDFPPATIFLPRWQITRQKNSYILVANTVINIDINIKLISDEIWNQINKISSSKYKSLIIPSNGSVYLKKINMNNTSQFETSVKSVLELIQAKYFSKIVLSHAIDVFSNTEFNLINSLDNLRLIYPGCYIFSTSNGKGQNFMGASPERLISIHNHQLVTDALAGSAPRGKTISNDTDLANGLLCSEKDLREHRAVIDFIIERLYNLGITPHISPRPYLLQLSNIQHLWTPIKAQVSPEIHLLKILAELHPTPAVAGVPRDIALEQIRRYETFDRSLYAAPLGWVDHQGNGEFAVGIRSAFIDSNRARLYAGAGIVSGSEPDKELAEIKLKLQALLNALV